MSSGPGFIFDGVSKPIDVATADVDDILAHFGRPDRVGRDSADRRHGGGGGLTSLAAVAADMNMSDLPVMSGMGSSASVSASAAALPSVPAASPTSTAERTRRPLAAADSDSAGNEFWTEVEGFLSRPAPRVGKIASAPTLAASMSLPTLKKERAALRKAGLGTQPVPRASGSGAGALRPSPVASAASTTDSRAFIRSGSGLSLGSSAGGGIDPALLAQAFQYTAGAVSDDDAPARSSSAPSVAAGAVGGRRKSTGIVRASGSRRNRTGGPPGGSTGTKTAKSRGQRPPSGGVRRRRPPKSADAAAASAYSKPLRRKSGAGRKGAKGSSARPVFASGSGGKGGLTKDGSLPKEHVDKLVERFELGLGVEELKRQLAESQERMQRSKSVITEAANEFYGH